MDFLNKTNKKELNYNSIIERIVKTSLDKLNDWELEFISSVYEKALLQNRNLSDKQKEIILKINHKILHRL